MIVLDISFFILIKQELLKVHVPTAIGKKLGPALSYVFRNNHFPLGLLDTFLFTKTF